MVPFDILMQFNVKTPLNKDPLSLVLENIC